MRYRVTVYKGDDVLFSYKFTITKPDQLIFERKKIAKQLGIILDDPKVYIEFENLDADEY